MAGASRALEQDLEEEQVEVVEEEEEEQVEEEEAGVTPRDLVLQGRDGTASPRKVATAVMEMWGLGVAPMWGSSVGLVGEVEEEQEEEVGEEEEGEGLGQSATPQ